MKLLYLDQKDISNIAKGRVRQEDAETVQRLVDGGQVAIVVSPTHAIETAVCSDQALRGRVINYVDHLSSRRWMRDSLWIQRKEVERCFVEDMTGLHAPSLSPFTSSILEIHDLTDPAQVQGGWDITHEFRRMVNMWHERGGKDLQRIRESKAVWPAFSKQSRIAKKGKTVSEYARREDTWKFVPKRTPSGLYVNEKGRREYASGLDFARCPALALVLQVEDKVHADVKARAGTGDILDIMHLCAVPYCDMVTTDRRMHGIILQTALGKAFRDRVACKLADAVRKLEI